MALNCCNLKTKEISMSYERTFLAERNLPGVQKAIPENRWWVAARTLLLAAIWLLLISSRHLTQPSQAELQFLKLRAEVANFGEVQDDLKRRQASETARVTDYNDQLLKVAAEFQMHIADRHQDNVSCEKCRLSAKRMTELSRNIERGVR